MTRGEIWTVSGAKDYAGKPRPVVIIQNSAFDEINSVTLCGLTTEATETGLFRVPVQPSPDNGLRSPSWVMVEKITTVPKTKLGRHIGHLAAADILRLNKAIVIFLGLTASVTGQSSS